VADSAFLLNVDNIMEPAWVTEAVSWANEPIRRMRHSASSAGGKIFLIGGEKVDGSGEVFSDHYVFDISVPSFTLLPSSNGPPDLYGHTSIVLDNGSLIVFGGYCGTQATLLPLTTIWMMDTTQPTLAWSLVSVSNASVPTPRLAFAAAPVENGKIIIHGGADASSGNTYSDGWMLDTTQNPMVWSQVDALSQLGSRRDHFAVASGSQVLFGFGKCSIVLSLPRGLTLSKVTQ
jgi:N-acetylneuraminic acid mutarotase